MIAESTCKHCNNTFKHEWKGRSHRICPDCQAKKQHEYNTAYNKNPSNIRRRKRLMKIYRSIPANKERMLEMDRLRYPGNTVKSKDGIRIYHHRLKKPKKRSDCINGKRPCVWISCKHHMVWVMVPAIGDFRPEPLIKRFIDRHTNNEILEMMDGLSESCTLDVADKHGLTLEQVSQIMGMTRERVRQIEEGGINRLCHYTNLKMINDFRVSPHV